MPAEEYFRFASFEGLEERLKHLYPTRHGATKNGRVTSSAWSLSGTILKMGFPGTFSLWVTSFSGP